MKKIIVIMCMLFSVRSFAETVVSSGYFLNKTIEWNKEGSPYIIKGRVTLASSTLNINDAEMRFEGGSIDAFSSFINMNVVDIKSEISTININAFDSKVSVNTVTLDTHNFIEAYNSAIQIDNLNSYSSSTGKLVSLYNGSHFSMIDSRIENYQGTILNVLSAGSLMIKNTEFVHNAKVFEVYRATSSLINGNDFENNEMVIESYDKDINLEHNYYQKDSIHVYPFKEDADPDELNVLAGPFSITDFSKTKLVQKKEPCCSNILFLPGVMGSRLYEDDNQLWEPNRNADVKKLFLDSFGQSIHTVVTKDIIAKTNLASLIPGVDQNIYQDFIGYLDSLKKNKHIVEYNALPYDWRMSPDSILLNGIYFKDKHVELVQAVRDLQKTSKTKKVTIITHSNGGLVAKQLVLDLQRSGLDDMVDKIIFVGMPEYGTPQAITALLYGHNQSILHGLILKSSVAKALAQNMATAYTLLPSDKYYVNKGASQLQNELIIHDYDNLNRTLLSKAKELHQTLDNMKYPDHISIYNILGTGLNTVSDVQNSKKDPSKVLPLYDKNGDGVVQDLYGLHFGTTTYIDLNNTKYSHVNMMNSPMLISNMDYILNPKKYVGEHPGLDYNKIIKNNNYKLLRITPSENKLSKYITPLDMDLGIGLSQLNQNTDNELFFDKLSGISRGEFREVKESLYQGNRFELMDDGINYLYTNDIKNFSVTAKTNNTIDIDVIESIDGEIKTSEYTDIPIFKSGELVFTTTNDFSSLNVTLPLTGQMLELQSEEFKTGRSVDEQVTTIETQISSSKMEQYLKDRYVRRLDMYRQNKDPKYISVFKQRIGEAINSINSMSYSLILTARYAKLKEDYIYLNMLLLKL